MKIEFLSQGATDCPLIRLFSFTRNEADSLRKLLNDLSTGVRTSVVLHDQPGFHGVGRCKLNLRLGNRDKGVIQTDASEFDCVLTATEWDNMAELVTPFCGSGGTIFQWLCRRNKISLLLSVDGRW